MKNVKMCHVWRFRSTLIQPVIYVCSNYLISSILYLASYIQQNKKYVMHCFLLTSVQRSLPLKHTMKTVTFAVCNRSTSHDVSQISDRTWFQFTFSPVICDSYLVFPNNSSNIPIENYSML